MPAGRWWRCRDCSDWSWLSDRRQRYELVSDVGHRDDSRRARYLAELLAELPGVDAQVLRVTDAGPPYRIEYRIVRDDITWLTGQEEEELEFGGGEVDAASGD